MTEQMAQAAPERLVTAQLVSVAACALFFFLALGMTFPVLPRLITDDLGGGSLAVGLVVGVMAVASVGIRPWAGRLSDLWGRRRMVMIGAATGAVSFAGYALAPELVSLSLLRLVTGAGMALLFVGAVTMVTDLSPERRRGEAVSYFSLAPWIGISVGPALGELVAQAGGDRAAFVAAGCLAAAGVAPALGMREMRNEADSEHVGLSPRIHRDALGPGSVLALGLFGGVAFLAFLPLYARQIGLGGGQYVFLVYGSVILLIRLAGSRIPDRFGARPVGTIATLQIALGLALIALQPSAIALYAGTLVFAVGMALQFPALMTLTVNRVPAAERASAVATFSMFFDVAQGVGGAVLGAVASLGGYRASFAGGAMFALLALVLLRTRVAHPRQRSGRATSGGVCRGPAGPAPPR